MGVAAQGEVNNSCMLDWLTLLLGPLLVNVVYEQKFFDFVKKGVNLDFETIDFQNNIIQVIGNWPLMLNSDKPLLIISNIVIIKHIL